ncbi:lysoplasmalogenase [Polaribacter sp. Z014]|uniref:lysoplasmalogenase n=1 Tax=unclassified Polaribacter TaxID=196858 RepID=UPI00193BA5DF|nr:MULTISPECIES: lysoplasmalogenase [unclassified Polaribacter]MCL7763124.1 lysoplasmalogenase [Polaribacter sp. Z014]QVY65453.1 lysoplasmalogenase [Polaribacter sp. Q13]
MKNHNKTLSASAFFLIVVVLHLSGLLFNDTLAFITKPFIAISLVMVYLTSVNKANYWYVAALFFSLWGDLFLLLKAEFFMFGLVAFLMAHILYIKIAAGYVKKINFIKIITASIPFIIVFGAVVFLISEHLGAMLFPVIVYGIVICSFGTLTLLNYLQEKSTENLWFFLGAVFFILSDSLLAINKFYEAREVYGISIMITYIVAQYLICKTMIGKSNSVLNS